MGGPFAPEPSGSHNKCSHFAGCLQVPLPFNMRFDKLKRYKPLILNDLKRTDSENPVKMTKLAIRYGINSRVVRDAINELRSVDGQPICGDNKGYYWPKYKQEWERTAARLGSYVKRIQEAINGGNSYYKQDDQGNLF